MHYFKSLYEGGAHEGQAEQALRPWIEVALPHPDVLANRTNRGG
jgi:hypothetical protein